VRVPVVSFPYRKWYPSKAKKQVQPKRCWPYGLIRLADPSNEGLMVKEGVYGIPIRSKKQKWVLKAWDSRFCIKNPRNS